jgi:hypothetical protein
MNQVKNVEVPLKILDGMSYLPSVTHTAPSHSYQVILDYPFTFSRKTNFFLSASYFGFAGAKYPQRLD